MTPDLLGRRPRLALAATACVAVLVLYLPFLGAPFEYDDKVEILTNRVLRSPADVGEMVRYVAWIKPHGQGRVFYCSPSHFPESYQSATLLQFILDGVQYAAGDLKCDDSTP